MNKKTSPLSYFRILILAASVVLLIVAAAPSWTPRVTSAPLPPEQEVRQTLQRANEARSYRFTSSIVRTTRPLPVLENVGLGSQREQIYIEGQVNRPEELMELTIWADEQGLATPGSGVELRVEGEQAYGRANGYDWEELDEDLTGTFAENDALGYLVAAKNVTRIGSETRYLPFSAPPQSPPTLGGKFSPSPTLEEKSSPPPELGEGPGAYAST